MQDGNGRENAGWRPQGFAPSQQGLGHPHCPNRAQGNPDSNSREGPDDRYPNNEIKALRVQEFAQIIKLPSQCSFFARSMILHVTPDHLTLRIPCLLWVTACPSCDKHPALPTPIWPSPFHPEGQFPACLADVY